MSSNRSGEIRKSTRHALSGQAEVRDAAEDIARRATKSLTIFTQDLEPSIYDQDSFLQIVKHMVLSRAYSRVRVLVANPQRAVKDGHRLITLGRRLNTYVEFRNVHKDFADCRDAYLIADDVGIVYRPDASRWEGMSDQFSPAVARRYLGEFDRIWAASIQEPDLRVMHL